MITDDSIGEVTVECTLCPTFEHQQVIVGKAMPEQLPVEITDATVLLSSAQQTVPLRHTGKGIYRDIETSLVYTPDTEYRLMVTLTDGRTVTGTIRTPGAFQITEPAAGDTIDHTLSPTVDTTQVPMMEWSPCAHSSYYALDLKIDHPH